jgi:hypothetical protein
LKPQDRHITTPVKGGWISMLFSSIMRSGLTIILLELYLLIFIFWRCLRLAALAATLFDPITSSILL